MVALPARQRENTMSRLSLTSLTSVFIVILQAGVGKSQTVEDLIQKNLGARGGLERLKAVQTVRMTGTMVNDQMEGALILKFKRPNSSRIELTVQGMTAIQAFDGRVSWILGPEETDARLESGYDLKERQNADFDGALVDYKEKGSKVELAGKDEVDGIESYRLRVTLKNGDVQFIHLDSERFIEIKIERREKEVEAEYLVGDYREVGGILYAHTLERGIRGKPEKERILIDRIELNVPIDDAEFKTPRPRKRVPRPDDPLPPVTSPSNHSIGAIKAMVKSIVASDR